MQNKYNADFHSTTVRTEMFETNTYIISDTQVNDSVMTDVVKQIAKKERKVENMSVFISVSAMLFSQIQ